MNSNLKLLPAALLTAVLALAGCGGGGDTTPMPTPEEQCTAGGGTYADGNCKSAEQVAAEDAIAAAYMAAAGLDATSDDAAISAAESLIMAAQTAIAALSMDEAAENAAVLATAESLASAWRAALTAQAAADAAKTAEEQRLADEEAERARQAAEEARMAAEAMAATAAKLYAGIGAPTAADVALARHAAYNDAGTPTDSTADQFISVTTTDATSTATVAHLSEDKDAMVAALHGWEGMRFTAEPDGDGGTYEAHVYSHVGDPTEGAVFNVAYTLNAADAATNPGELPLTTAATSLADQAAINAEVDSSLFDQTAGTKEFEKGANLTRLIIPGSFSGVPGNYYCLPAASSTCAVRVAAAGFELGVTADADNAFTLGSWTFKPTDPEQKLMNTPDNMYASYGWWLHKSEDDSTYTASAFHDYKGTDENPVGTDGLTNLNGTATYSGGAAGKYALSSTTGGTNDAGHFTADDVSLEANFTEDMITGTINGFTGADGQSRNWSVKLNSAGMGNNGAIVGTADGEDFGDTNPYVGTVWTIGETAADAAGQWSGQMHELGDDGVPGIATGTFYSEFGRDGRMVGAFGANAE